MSPGRNRSMRATLLAALLALGAARGAAHAQAPDSLTPAKRRITDEAIARDMALIRGWKRRTNALPAEGTPDAVYAREKARGWFDFAFEEYTDNDRTAVVDGAFGEGMQLVRAAEAGGPVTRTTALVSGTSRVRPDLQERLDRLKAGPAFACAPREIARAEVELLRAGHETSDGASCRAAPHEKEAERLVHVADSLAALCERAAKPAEPVTPVQPVQPVTPRDTAPTPPVAEEPVTVEIPNVVHFAFDRSRLIGASREVLDTIVSRIGALPAGATIEIDGHTDVRGSARYNLALSRRRAEAVRRYLVAHGVDAARLRIVAKGKGQPAVIARTKLEHARNRRVELRVDLAPPPRVIMYDQEEDLQPQR